MPNEIFHAIFVERRDTIVEKENKECNDTTYQPKQFCPSWVVQRIMIKNAVIIERYISGKLIGHKVDVYSFIVFGRFVIVGLSGSGIVLVCHDQFSQGDV